MDEGITRLDRAGASGDLKSQFRAVVENERFEGGDVGLGLAAIITGARSRDAAGKRGRNKDSAVLELCHLVHALTGLGVHDRGDRLMFFLSPGPVTAGRLRREIERLASGRAGAPGNVTAGERGIVVDYGEERFEIWYTRMPTLVALFEFLLGLDGSVYAAEFEDVLESMPAPPAAPGVVKSAAGRIAARLRRFRKEHMVWSRHQEHFDRIAVFLALRDRPAPWTIDDACIFDFWCRHSEGVNKPIREYETVFKAFVELSALLQTAAVSGNAGRARRLGTDTEAGEIDIGFDADDPAMQSSSNLFPAEWDNPLRTLDQPDVRAIRVLKASSERDPIERLMQYGPDALRFAHAFLRLESFGPVQKTIGNALRFGRGAEAVRRSAACGDAASYPAFLEALARIREHLRTVQLATYHGLSAGSRRNTAPPELRAEAEAAFRGIRRKGFETAEPDADRREAFAEIAGALTRMTGLIDGFRKSVERRGASAGGLDAMFTRDRDLFAAQFRRLYGGSQ